MKKKNFPSWNLEKKGLNMIFCFKFRALDTKWDFQLEIRLSLSTPRYTVSNSKTQERGL